MKTIDCHVCGAKRGAKRHIGIGTILLMILSFIVLVAGSIGFWFFIAMVVPLTVIFWAIIIAFYPVRCIVCGTKGERELSKEEKAEEFKCRIFILCFLVGLLLFLVKLI